MLNVVLQFNHVTAMHANIPVSFVGLVFLIVSTVWNNKIKQKRNHLNYNSPGVRHSL